MYNLKASILIVTAFIVLSNAQERCEHRCNVDANKRGFIQYDSQPLSDLPFTKHKHWVLQSSTPTTFLLHLTKLQEILDETQGNSGGLTVSYYQKKWNKQDENRPYEYYGWTPPAKLLSQENEILFIQEAKTVWIFWVGARGQEIEFNINFHVGCDYGYGPDIKFEKKAGSEDTCWIIVPQTADKDIVKIETRFGTYEAKRLSKTETTFATLQHINVKGGATVTLSNLAEDADESLVVEKLAYEGTEEILPISFQRTQNASIAVNKLKLTTVMFLDIKCEENVEDCRETTFKFSSRALSSKDESCINNEMVCRLDGSASDECLEDYTTTEQTDGSRSYTIDESRNEVTPIENLVWSRCESYTGVVADIVGEPDVVGPDESGETGRLARISKQMLAQCNTKQMSGTFCSRGGGGRKYFNCFNLRNPKTPFYYPTCYKWCLFLQIFYCEHMHKFNLF